MPPPGLTQPVVPIAAKSYDAVASQATRFVGQLASVAGRVLFVAAKWKLGKWCFLLAVIPTYQLTQHRQVDRHSVDTLLHSHFFSKTKKYHFLERYDFIHF